MNYISRTVLIGLFMFGLSLGTAQMATAQLGVAGGINFESADDLEGGNSEAVLENQTGYHFGLVYDLNLGPASLRPGIMYRKIGTYTFDIGGVQIEDESFDLSAIEVPLDVRFGVLSTPAVSPYVLAGPMMTFIRTDDGFEQVTEDYSFSLNVGVGAEIGKMSGIRVLPELRYEFGATKLFEDDFEIGGTQFDPQNEPRFSALSLRLHLLF